MSLGLAVVMVLIGLIAVTLARWLGAPEPLAYVIGSAIVIETLILPVDGPAPHWLAGAATATAVLWAVFAWDRRKVRHNIRLVSTGPPSSRAPPGAGRRQSGRRRRSRCD